MFITDFILLVTMLFGLLRFRLRGAGSFGLGRLLWKQVSLAVLGCLQFSPSANVISIREGVMWLLLATIAELPPVVRPTSFHANVFIDHAHCFIRRCS